MKIISGKYKGRNLDGHNLDGTRPTMERVKESLFAIIQNHLDNAIVLDLFSGSGNLGIEALSEGASYAYLVDFNKKAAITIKNNLNNIGINEAEVINLDYKKALNYLKDKKMDLIFLDPPYNPHLSTQIYKKSPRNFYFGEISQINRKSLAEFRSADRKKVQS